MNNAKFIRPHEIANSQELNKSNHVPLENTHIAANNNSLANMKMSLFTKLYNH